MKTISFSVKSDLLTSLLTVMFASVAGVISLFAGTNSVCILIPLFALLILSTVSRMKTVPLVVGAICAVLFLKLNDAYANFSLILLSGLIILIAATFYCSSGIPVKFAYYIARRTKTRREFFTAMILFGSLFSLLPEIGASITGVVFGETGNRLGVSKEKTALYANLSAALLGTMFFASVWVVGIVEAARSGLDKIGGQVIPAFQFLTTTIQYNYFAISLTLLLAMSASNMKDIGLIYRSELRARREMDIDDIKENIEVGTNIGRIYPKFCVNTAEG